MFASMKNVFAAGLLLATIAVGAQAGDHGYGGYGHTNHGYGHSQPAWSWKTITVYETVRKPIVKYVTQYKPCGTPYQEEVVTYKTVKVPVQKRIRVYH